MLWKRPRTFPLFFSLMNLRSHENFSFVGEITNIIYNPSVLHSCSSIYFNFAVQIDKIFSSFCIHAREKFELFMSGIMTWRLSKSCIDFVWRDKDAVGGETVTSRHGSWYQHNLNVNKQHPSLILINDASCLIAGQTLTFITNPNNWPLFICCSM